MKKLVIEIIGTLLAGIAIFVLINISVQYSIVEGSSMEPNLHNGQRLLINKIAYSNPQRGDIIIFPPPHIANSEKDFIKRIIGLPGELIEIKDGVAYINDVPLDEPYIADNASITMSLTLIPDGQYFVLGDNRGNSSDSRGGWTVPEEDIVGKAWLSIWPPSEWGLAPNYDLQPEPGDQAFFFPNAEAEPVAG
ncbi:MAG: signal peptidase I [Dehalococcoidales bacterium]